MLETTPRASIAAVRDQQRTWRHQRNACAQDAKLRKTDKFAASSLDDVQGGTRHATARARAVAVAHVDRTRRQYAAPIRALFHLRRGGRAGLRRVRAFVWFDTR
ncbi:hypothetical protein [Xanthomonas oryzae]|uniref:hypothetical protein n=1 Tax=Xanthomonas oryzae TaxID=347 RepID=UPI003CCFF5B4